MQHLAIKFFVPLIAFAAVGAAEEVNSITEKKVLEYASKQYDKGLFREPTVILGSLNGVQVFVEHVCSDICPNYTVRIIRFSLPTNVKCECVGGIEKMVRVPIGIGAGEQQFCFPKVLVENWDAYIR